MKRQLILEDGSVFIGRAFGSLRPTQGEVVFNTGMTGYQEILSDPSYCGQIITFTYPLVGNYGVNRDDFESITPWLSGVIVKEACCFPSNWRSQLTLDEFLRIHDIPGLEGIDTRRLTRLIRTHGTLRGRICSLEENSEEVAGALRQWRSLPPVPRVSTPQMYACPGRGYRIVLVDFGMKRGILRELSRRGCDVVVVPYNTAAQAILELQPDGVVLSNGPGDPKDVPEALVTIRKLINLVPVLGICLGHQLVALACGGDTVKMKFGHRGSNHPVLDLRSNRVSITSQNHGYAVDPSSLAGTDLVATHTALNDGTVEGLRHRYLPVFTVQYHPEASPGPEDDVSLFDEFISLITSEKTERRRYA